MASYSFTGTKVITASSAQTYASWYAGGSTAVKFVGSAATTALWVGGSVGADSLYGGYAGDRLSGNAGNDILFGLAGNDTVNGGAGNDSIVGGLGNDVLAGGIGNDTFAFGANFGVDSVADFVGNDVYTFSGYSMADLSFSFASPGSSTTQIVDADGVTKVTTETVGSAAGGIKVATVTGNNSVTFAGMDTTAAKKNYFVVGGNSFHVLAASGVTGAYTSGTTANDYIVGGANVAGIINGLGGNDTIIGGSGNDTIYYYSDLAYVSGAAGGTNVLTASYATAPVTIDLASTRYTNIQAVIGGAGNDVLLGKDNQNDGIFGGLGNDSIWGRGGNDWLSGGAGNDTYVWGAADGIDTIVATSDSDVIKFNNVNFADAVFSGTSGTNSELFVKVDTSNYLEIDSFGQAASKTNTFEFSDKTLHIFKQGADGVTVSGTTGADYMRNFGTTSAAFKGLGGADTLIGGSANDTFYYYSDLAFVSGGSGKDVISASDMTASVTIDMANTTKFSSIESIYGGSGSDVLRGDLSNNTLFGGAGNDQLWGAAGNDSLSGGAGADTYYYTSTDGRDRFAATTDNDVTVFSNLKFSDVTLSEQSSTGIYVDVDNSNYLQVTNLSQATSLTNTFKFSDKTVHIFTQGASGAIGASGTTGSDYMRNFGASAAVFKGLGGADTLIGGTSTGADTFYFNYNEFAYVSGGAGNDMLTASYMTSAQQATIDMYYTTNFSSIEIAKGGAGADLLRGSADDNTLYGLAGNDLLWGVTGNDLLIGGSGADTYYFGSGDGMDTITGTTDQDVVSMYNLSFANVSMSTSGDTLVMATSSDNTLTVNNLTQAVAKSNSFAFTDQTLHIFKQGAAGVAVSGTTGADYMRNFSTGAAVFKGLGGADTIIGGSSTGADTFYFYNGVGYISGGAGNDMLTASYMTTAATIDLYNDTRLNSIEWITGGRGNDVLRGTTNGNETLMGGAGSDKLWGAGANDLLSGGTGNDTYWFGVADGIDTINATTDSDVINFYNASKSQFTFSSNSDQTSLYYIADSNNYLTMSGMTAAKGRSNTVQFSDSTFHVIAAASGTVTGTTDADYMRNFGTTADVFLDGKGGNDTLVGSASASTKFKFYAGLGQVTGGSSTSDLLTASYMTANQSATIDLYYNSTRYQGIEMITGGAGSDVLRGSSSNDTITGGAGNDAIWGATGNDMLSGGTGIDTYWFGTGDGQDTIAANSSNPVDYVKFYTAQSQSSVTASLDGSTLHIALASGDQLTLNDWTTSANKVNKFTFTNGKTMMLSSDATTWSEVTS